MSAKECVTCRITKPISSFGRHRSQKDGLAKQCKECGAAYRATNKEQIKDRCARYYAANREAILERRNPVAKWAANVRRYGITIAQYEEMVSNQGNLCAICKRPERVRNRRLSIDHDHSCCPGSKSCGKCVRGLLCSNCNRALGLLGDSAETVRAVLAYLEKD